MTFAELLAEVSTSVGGQPQARWLIDEVTNGQWSPSGDASPFAAAAREMACQVSSGQPLQYVLGHWAFRDLDLLVDERVLIPRPETEYVVERALEAFRRGSRSTATCVDLGTGSGAIACALATELSSVCSKVSVLGVDISPDALELASLNVARTGAHVELRQGSWWDGVPPELEGLVDLVISNPPYVTEEEYAELDDTVLCEPRLALVGATSTDGIAGFGPYESIVDDAQRFLARGAVLAFECAPAQVGALRALCAHLGEVSTIVDLAGRDRGVIVECPW
ncbi:MAG: HemK/PrmC family methyltransferase [Actinomycetota bacterium]